METYVLKYGKNEVNAIMYKKIMNHSAIMRLLGDIDQFRADNFVILNFHTLEMRLVKNPKVFVENPE
jgi:hypothetical protein